MNQNTINERLKYVAGAFDRASTAVMTIGVFTPFISVTFGIGDFIEIRGAGGILIVICWLITGLALHYWGRSVLEDVK